ncbi:unnamed protein product, partial [Didymodactylos carnosus]
QQADNGGSDEEQKQDTSSDDEEESEEETEGEEEGRGRSGVRVYGENRKYIDGQDYAADQPLKGATLTGTLSTHTTHVPYERAHGRRIVKYKLESGSNRVPYVRAVISSEHLGHGEPRAVTSEGRVCVRLIRQLASRDDIGHIVGARLGGPLRLHNVFPQNPSVNRGIWRQEYEAPMHSWVSQGSCFTVDFQVRFLYEDESTPDRPSSMLVLIKFLHDGRLATTKEVWQVLGGRDSIVEPIIFDQVPNPPSYVSFRREGEEDYEETTKNTKS